MRYFYRLVEVTCKVRANPWPFKIEWYKEDDPEFHQTGDTLRLSGITADHNGRYVCSATNSLQPSAGPKVRNCFKGTSLETWIFYYSNQLYNSYYNKM